MLQNIEDLLRSTDYGHWGPIIGTISTEYGHWGPIISFRLTDYGQKGILPEICCSYGPYMDFSTENVTSEVHMWTFEGKLIEDFEIQNLNIFCQNFKMALSTSSTHPNFTISKEIKTIITIPHFYPLWGAYSYFCIKKSRWAVRSTERFHPQRPLHNKLGGPTSHANL